MFVGKVYVFGPKTVWSRRIDDSEVIATFTGPWRWLVRLQTVNAWRSLNPDRCGYAVLNEDECVEHSPIFVNHN